LFVITTQGRQSSLVREAGDTSILYVVAIAKGPGANWRWAETTSYRSVRWIVVADYCLLFSLFF